MSKFPEVDSLNKKPDELLVSTLEKKAFKSINKKIKSNAKNIAMGARTPGAAVQRACFPVNSATHGAVESQLESQLELPDSVSAEDIG